MFDLLDIVSRIEDGESFMVKYRLAGSNECEVMTSKLLDVAEDKGRVFVHCGNKIIWIELSEVVAVYPEE